MNILKLLLRRSQIQPTMTMQTEETLPKAIEPTAEGGVLGGVLVHPALRDLSPLVGEGSAVMIWHRFTGEVFRCTLLCVNRDGDGSVDCRFGGGGGICTGVRGMWVLVSAMLVS